MFEVSGQIGAEGVCGGLRGVWVVSRGDVGWPEKLFVWRVRWPCLGIFGCLSWKLFNGEDVLFVWRRKMG